MRPARELVLVALAGEPDVAGMLSIKAITAVTAVTVGTVVTAITVRRVRFLVLRRIKARTGLRVLGPTACEWWAWV
jgi:hypothetical protein